MTHDTRYTSHTKQHTTRKSTLIRQHQLQHFFFSMQSYQRPLLLSFKFWLCYFAYRIRFCFCRIPYPTHPPPQPAHLRADPDPSMSSNAACLPNRRHRASRCRLSNVIYQNVFFNPNHHTICIPPSSVRSYRIHRSQEQKQARIYLLSTYASLSPPPPAAHATAAQCSPSLRTPPTCPRSKPQPISNFHSNFVFRKVACLYHLTLLLLTFTALFGPGPTRYIPPSLLFYIAFLSSIPPLSQRLASAPYSHPPTHPTPYPVLSSYTVSNRILSYITAPAPPFSKSLSLSSFRFVSPLPVPLRGLDFCVHTYLHARDYDYTGLVALSFFLFLLLYIKLSSLHLDLLLLTTTTRSTCLGCARR
ncbi:hypothetical protein CPC08DRAFT_160832 [Agrocybe pediades]|nr:hypothetical protein CPC08DRAFT_160832 [Agrocybe pediades]